LRNDFIKSEETYQAAIASIYEVLGKVFAQYAVLKTETNSSAVIKVFDQMIADLKADDQNAMTATKATTLDQKVIRFVMGNALSDYREKAYATCLKVALKARVQNKKTSFAAWVIAQGGIDAISRPAKKTAAAKSKRRKNAYKQAAKFHQTSEVVSPVPVMLPANTIIESDSQYAVALIRKDKNGLLGQIVKVVDEKAPVLETLRAIGHSMDLDAEAKKKAEEEKKAQEAAQKLIDEAHQKIIANAKNEVTV